MPGALRESLIGPAPGASVGRPSWVAPEELIGCVDPCTLVDLAEVCGAVSENLFQLSGRRYKQRRVIVRPQPRSLSCGGWMLGYSGGWAPTTGFDAWAWGWGDRDAQLLKLAAPVQQVLAVKIDGLALNPGDVELYDGRYLIRANGLAWPSQQAIELPDSEAGTFSVSYVWGQAIPTAGRIAARAWACYLANQLAALSGEGDCSLPDRVTQLVRQGVTLSKLSAQDFIEKGRVGVDVVDQWLNVVNPSGARRPASIASPDSVRGMRQQ